MPRGEPLSLMCPSPGCPVLPPPARQVIAQDVTMLLFAIGFMLWVLRYGMSQACTFAVEE